MTASSPIATALRVASPKYTPSIRPTFGWLLRSPMQQEPSKLEAPSPSLFLFFSSLNSPPETMGKHPPPRAPPVRITSPKPPPLPTPSFGWLSSFFFKWRPPRLVRRPSLQFVDGRHFGAPNKGIERSARDPGRRTPLLGSWGAAAPRFESMAGVAMEREGEAAGGRVAAAHLELCVVVGSAPRLGFLSTLVYSNEQLGTQKILIV